MNKTLPSILIIALFLIASCAKEKSVTSANSSPSSFIAIHPELKRHFSFPVGSYWVYRDSLRSAKDSFYVSNNISYADPTSYAHPEMGGYIENDISITEITSDGTSVSDTNTWHYILRYDKITVYFNWANKLFSLTYPFAATDSSFTLNGNSFAKTLIFNSQSNRFYLNDSVGIIKMRLAQTDTAPPARVWELQKWKLNW